jgi:hypothetical protein
MVAFPPRQRWLRRRDGDRGRRNREGRWAPAAGGNPPGRGDSGQLRSPLGAVGNPAVEGVVPQDEAKPLVGSRIQPDLGAVGGRCAGADRLRDADIGGCDPDVSVDGGGRAECPVAAAPGSAARGQRTGTSLRIWLGFVQTSVILSLQVAHFRGTSQQTLRMNGPGA